jgi:hypothetical protein
MSSGRTVEISAPLPRDTAPSPAKARLQAPNATIASPSVPSTSFNGAAHHKRPGRGTLARH